MGMKVGRMGAKGVHYGSRKHMLQHRNLIAIPGNLFQGTTMILPLLPLLPLLLLKDLLPQVIENCSEEDLSTQTYIFSVLCALISVFLTNKDGLKR